MIRKYRGKDYDGKWRYGMLQWKNRPYIDPINDPEFGNADDREHRKVHPDSVGQEIGRKDNNTNIEMYEGDFIMWKQPFEDYANIGVIEYVRCCFRINFNPDYTSEHDPMRHYRQLDCFNQQTETLKIIGNKTDNPELYKKCGWGVEVKE